jgi:hypothetical protein
VAVAAGAVFEDAPVGAGVAAFDGGFVVDAVVEGDVVEVADVFLVVGD